MQENTQDEPSTNGISRWGCFAAILLFLVLGLHGQVSNSTNTINSIDRKLSTVLIKLDEQQRQLDNIKRELEEMKRKE